MFMLDTKTYVDIRIMVRDTLYSCYADALYDTRKDQIQLAYFLCDADGRPYNDIMNSPLNKYISENKYDFLFFHSMEDAVKAWLRFKDYYSDTLKAMPSGCTCCDINGNIFIKLSQTELLHQGPAKMVQMPLGKQMEDRQVHVFTQQELTEKFMDLSEKSMQEMSKDTQPDRSDKDHPCQAGSPSYFAPSELRPCVKDLSAGTFYADSLQPDLHLKLSNDVYYNSRTEHIEAITEQYGDIATVPMYVDFAYPSVSDLKVGTAFYIKDHETGGIYMKTSDTTVYSLDYRTLYHIEDARTKLMAHSCVTLRYKKAEPVDSETEEAQTLQVMDASPDDTATV